MEENVKLDRSQVVSSSRGRFYEYQNGNRLYVPESGEKGSLYKPVGTPLKNGSLQKSNKTYKVQVSTPLTSKDPAAELRTAFNKVMEPLEKDCVPKVDERAAVVGKTTYSVVSASEEEVQIVFRIPRNLPNPRVAGWNPEFVKQQGLNVHLDPQEVLTKEVMEVCSIISSISTMTQKSSAPRKRSPKSAAKI